MDTAGQIRSALTQVLRDGLLLIRAEGLAGNAQRCAVEAHHLHNLPGLIGKFSEPEFAYYMRVTRLSYLKQLRGGETPHRKQWELLDKLAASDHEITCDSTEGPKE